MSLLAKLKSQDKFNHCTVAVEFGLLSHKEIMVHKIQERILLSVHSRRVSCICLLGAMFSCRCTAEEEVAAVC